MNDGGRQTAWMTVLAVVMSGPIGLWFPASRAATVPTAEVRYEIQPDPLEEESLNVAMGDAGWWATVPHEHLDAARGAYDAAPGLQLAFGIDRAVYADGALVARSSGQFGSLPAAAITPVLTLVQHGAGNAFAAVELASGALATVIQNTLDGRGIGVVTTIDATVNSLQLLKGVNLGASLQDALRLPLAGPR